jgi:hypothetical protein
MAQQNGLMELYAQVIGKIRISFFFSFEDFRCFYFRKSFERWS